MSSIAIPNDYIINKKYKSLVLVKYILSYSELPSYFLSHDFILYLMKFSTLLLKLNLCPTEYDFFVQLTFKNIFFEKDPITKKVVNIPLTPIKEISNKILDVLFELVELLKIDINMLLSLVPNNCEILFKILSNLDVIENSDINFLFDNYSCLLNNNIKLIQNKFLLSDDITEEINKELFKEAVKEDIRTLLFIPDHKLSYEIILSAVQYNGLALKYIRPILLFKKNIFSKQIIINIIEIAVKNNGIALQYIRSIFLLFSYKYEYSKEIIMNIIELAVQNNGLALEFVTDNNITEDIIKLAVQNNGFALEFVDKKYLTDKIIEFAVKQNGLALQFINKDEDEDILTYKNCIFAIKNNPLALQYVPDYNLTEEICILAIQSNGLALQFVPRDIKTYEICKLAVQSNTLALEYVPYPNRTKEIINIALQNN